MNFFSAKEIHFNQAVQVGYKRSGGLKNEKLPVAEVSQGTLADVLHPLFFIRYRITGFFSRIGFKNSSLIGYSALADEVKIKQKLYKKDTLKLSL